MIIYLPFCYVESDAVYVAEISTLLSRVSVDLVALTEYCLQDGRTGMENALRRTLVRKTLFIVS